jgi:hypothetical protein
VAVGIEFPSVDGLPSIPSAGLRPLFGDFFGTMPSSDFPVPCMSGLRVVPFPDRSVDPSTADDTGTSRFPSKEFPRMHRVFDCAGSDDG